ncbi:MAG: efflux RND transporter permease subunit [Balneolaceae bacterium]|nr:efflux RND transporter permease subunit [Balneolaceae bacterium]
MLGWFLRHKVLFLSIPTALVVLSMVIWLGFSSVFEFVGRGFNAVGLNIQSTQVWSAADQAFPGLGEEFMPPLDEGSFLLMPTTMPHVGVEQAKEYMQIDRHARVSSIPEVEMVVGKMGRTESALDPAPTSMFENVITYKSEFKTDEHGRRIRYRVDDNGEFVRNEQGNLIPDSGGKYYRQWRDQIESPDDIWEEIVSATNIPGLTSAPKLQPIETRQIMLQSGMRAPMGIKVKGQDLQAIEDFGIATGRADASRSSGVKPASVFADRIVGKPYLEIEVDREEIARYGLSMQKVQQYIEVALGGIGLTKTVEGRERYAVRVRYARERRDDPVEISKTCWCPLPAESADSAGTDSPRFTYRQGPQAIKSEDTFLIGYAYF